MDRELNEKQSNLTKVHLIRHGNYSSYLFEIFIELLKLCEMITTSFLFDLLNSRNKTRMP